MIRVLLVDDQTLIRQGIRMLLSTESDIQVVGEAANGHEALHQVEALSPDVVLMDVRMPELDGVSATREIVTLRPNLGVIILTTFDDEEYIFEGLRAGARGYLLKDISSDEMADAVRIVARGGALIQPSITRKVLSEFTRLSASDVQPSTPGPQKTQVKPGSEASSNTVEALTERELEVLQAIASGFSNREIAEKLFISEGTVKNHVSNLISKLNVRDRTQALIKARSLGLIE